MRAAHAAEVGHFGSFFRHGLIMELPRRFRIEREVELVFPAEFEARMGKRIIPKPRPGVSFGKVRRMGGNLIGNDSVADVLFGRQAQGVPSA